MMTASALLRPGAERPAPQPLDLTFSDFIGPTTDFAGPTHGFYEMTFSTVSPGTLLLEVQVPYDKGQTWRADRVVNPHGVEGTTHAVLAGGQTYRFNNRGKAPLRSRSAAAHETLLRCELRGATQAPRGDVRAAVSLLATARTTGRKGPAPVRCAGRGAGSESKWIARWLIHGLNQILIPLS
jgi:hypothetical protein